MISVPSSKVLVVGGEGFLGRHVTSALARTGADVTTTSRRDGPEGRHVFLDVVRSSGKELRTAVAGFDAVVNCSGMLAGSDEELVSVNVVAPARLVAAVADTAPRARFVQLGSAAEYGATGHDPAGVDESYATEPLVHYGFSKLAGSAAVLEAAQDAGVDAVVLRVFNPVGSGSPSTTLAGRVADRLHSAPGPQLQVGSLDAYRDFVDARDIAACVAASIQVTSLPSRLYNVGSGQAIQCRDLVTSLARIAGYDGAIEEDAPPSGRSASVSWQRANIERATTELSWKPQFSLEESLTELWRDRQ
ncbi:MAG: putative reductase [Pseudonocardiales bacterium]|nr:putative reductase [Pseudonocardiales bacterium]